VVEEIGSAAIADAYIWRQLPEQLEANLRALDRLQEQLNEAQKSLQDAQKTG
jgi:uncharacterized protein involved in exopolysaccharide biosynthesis